MTSEVLLMSLIIMEVFFAVSLPSKHLARVIVAVMAEAMEESFSLHELEASVLENAAAVPNLDNITTCTCRGHCLRDRGRNFCPCRSINSFCSSACHGEDFGRCMNNRKVQESNSEETESDFSMQGNGKSDGEGEEEVERRGRGRGRGRGRARRRGRGRNQGRREQTGAMRGRGRGGRRIGHGRGGRGGGRGRGRGRGNLIEVPNAAENQANHEQELVNLVEAMDIGTLRRFAIELLRRQPAAFADVVNGELAGGNGSQQPDLDPENNLPEWCNCGHCVTMQTQEENKCCAQVRRPCISRTNLFTQLVLDGNVLELAMRYREDVLVLNNVRSNENFRHAAYRQYVLWQHGRLGRGNRRVVPSCCVLAIRARYPSPNGLYRGYMPAQL